MVGDPVGRARACDTKPSNDQVSAGMADSSFISPAGEWEVSSDDKFFARTALYEMGWSSMSLPTLRIACAKYGGPIASTRDESQVVVVTGASMRPVVKIHSSSGQLQGAFAWDRGPIICLGWSTAEELMVVEDTGEVSLFDQGGARLPRQFSFGEECQRDGILECCVYDDGLVALTKAFALWSISGIQEPRLQRLASPKLTAAPCCMTVIPPTQTLSGSVEVLLGYGDAILVVDAETTNTVAAGRGVVTRLSVAPNGQFVAAFTEDGRLVVWVADFTKNLSEFSTESGSPPAALAWCGTDSVVVAWPVRLSSIFFQGCHDCIMAEHLAMAVRRDLLLLVGPYGDWVKLDLEQPVTLLQEVDGVRIISNERHEFLRRVPQSLVDIFKIGSTTPGALLFDARSLFDQQNPKADEVLRSIIDVLPVAVGNCVEAAGAELDVPRQSALLKAACYGRAFCPPDSFPRKRLLEVCRHLQLLNALRQAEIGIPMTMAQLEAHGPAAVLTRLVSAKRHLLALRIATMLDLNPEQVLAHWACAKISAAGNATDQQLRDDIVAKLKSRPNIRYTDIAAHAQAIGRKGLAAMLLEHESVASEQVPLLLRLGEDTRALARATESRDTDLVYLVLFSMYHSLPLQDFTAAIIARPAIRNLFLAYCSRTEPELLEQMYTTMGLFEGVAEMRVRESLHKANDASRLREGAGRRLNAVVMGDVIRLLEKAADFYSQRKEHSFQAKAAAEFAKLRKFQADLEDETGNACFVGLSVVATAQQCIKLGNHRAAGRVQSEFKLSDKRFWWLKVKTLAAAKDWDSLLALASEKKLPFGVEALIGVSKEYSAPEAVTARFIAQLPDGKRKAEEYTAVRMYQEAAETAAHARDSDMLSRIQGLVGSSSPLFAQIRDRLQASTR